MLKLPITIRWAKLGKTPIEFVQTEHWVNQNPQFESYAFARMPRAIFE